MIAHRAELAQGSVLPIAPPLSSREIEATSRFHLSGRRPGGGCCQPDYSVSFPGKPDLHCPCRYPERFFRRAPIFSPDVSGGHSRLRPAGRFTVPGLPGIFSLVAGPMGHGCPL
jgi:hypothetical protein